MDADSTKMVLMDADSTKMDAGSTKMASKCLAPHISHFNYSSRCIFCYLYTGLGAQPCVKIQLWQSWLLMSFQVREVYPFVPASNFYIFFQ